MKFSTTNGIPIFHSPKGRMQAVSTNGELDGGSAGKLALLDDLKPDLVLLLGGRTGMFLGLRSGAIIPEKNCKLVQVDVDGGEIGRTLPVDLGVVSDVGQFVAALDSKFTPALSRSFDSEWIQKALSLKETPSPFESQPETQPSGRLHPYHALKHVFSSIGKESIVILDGGEASGWASEVAHLCKPSVVLTSTGNLGFLGNGFGYALGAAVAAPDRQVIMIHGDGSAGFHFMELDTFKRMNLNIFTVVVNNYCWGMSSNGQQLVYGDKNPARPVSSLSPVAEYDRVAEALGNASAKLDRIENISETVKRLQKVEGPSCVNLIVDDKPIHPMTTAMVGQTEDPRMVVVPYYDNIPRAYYKL